MDLGGSHAMATIVDESGKSLFHHKERIADLSPAAVFGVLASVIAAAIADAAGEPIDGIGIGSPGNVDPDTGMIRWSPNFHWTDVPLGDAMRAKFSLPVFIGNDARCATLGEYVFGAGRGSKNFALLTLGTGIGGGMVADGLLLLGHEMGAGEFGHHTIHHHSGFTCGCGRVGCFEAHGSGEGLIRHALAVARSFPRSTLFEITKEKLGAEAIRDAAQAGDGHALAAWKNWIDDLALGIANVIAFVNPEVIALGGGVSTAGDFMLSPLRALVEARTTTVPHTEAPRSLQRFWATMPAPSVRPRWLCVAACWRPSRRKAA
ncbi:MAG: ROK family protein [Candidatus Baltobacteraceae bacterium]